MPSWPRKSLFVYILIPIAAALSHREAACQPRMVDVIQQRLKDRPDDPTLYYYLSLFQAADSNGVESVKALDQVSRLGKGFLPARGVGFENVWDDPAFKEVVKKLEQDLPRATNATELFRLGRELIPEGIAFDGKTESYYIGSIAARKIVRVDSAGAVTDLSAPGELDHVLGLTVDPKNGALYAVSTSALAGPGREKPVNRVVRYDLASGKQDRSIEVPGAAQLNDVAVLPGGDIYTTDSAAGAVYHIGGDGSIDTLVAPGRIGGANGLALAPDGSALYVAHSTGVSRIELSNKDFLPRIDIPKGETIAAIDGLYLDGNDLIGIQNVTNPGRVIRMPLRKDGKGVEKIETLLSHHHEAIDEPTTGVVVGRSFVLLATTQIGRFTPDGTIDSPETVKPPVVLSIDLDAPR